jgi:ferredoxin
MTYVIAEPCINTKDTACVDACPVDCIHPKKDDPKYATEQLLYIDPVECIDCGACVPVCPVSAIFALDDLPEKWNSFTELKAKTHCPSGTLRLFIFGWHSSENCDESHDVLRSTGRENANISLTTASIQLALRR